MTFPKELLNTTLHILGGILVTYIMVPEATIWVIITVMLGFGAARELIQTIRGKQQPWWIMTIDTLGWVLGGLIWFWLRSHFGIDADTI